MSPSIHKRIITQSFSNIPLCSNIQQSTFPHQPKAGGPPFLSRTGNVLHSSRESAFACLLFNKVEEVQHNIVSLFLQIHIVESTIHHSLMRMDSRQRIVSNDMYPLSWTHKSNLNIKLNAGMLSYILRETSISFLPESVRYYNSQYISLRPVKIHQRKQSHLRSHNTSHSSSFQKSFP